MVFALHKVLEEGVKSFNVNPLKVSEQEQNIMDFDDIDFESEDLVSKSSDMFDDFTIDFESEGPIEFPVSIAEEDIYSGLIKPTLKAMVKVPASIASSLALLPGAGVASLIDLIPTISTDPDKLVDFGTLDDAMDTYEKVMSIPSKFITTSEEAKAVENISLAMKPIEMAGEGWRLIGKAVNEGLVTLGLEPTYIEPLLATYGEAAAIFAAPSVIKRLGNSAWFRTLTVKERGLVVQSLADAMQKNPNMTEGQLLRTYDNPAWKAEALNKRSITENYSELKKYAEVKVRETKIDSTLKSRNKTPPKVDRAVKPVDAKPDSTFTSKKGNYYEKIGDNWFDNKGMEVTNRFVIAAAEKGKVVPEVVVPEVPPIDIQTIEKDLDVTYQGKGIGDLHNWRTKEGKNFSTKTLDVKEINESLANIKKGFEEVKVEESKVELKEPPTDIDLQPEPREPVQRTFRITDPEANKFNLEKSPPYKEIDNVDNLSARIEAEVNSWLDGDDSIDILGIKGLVSDLADSTKMWAAGDETPKGIFESMTLAELENVSEYLGQLNGWIRGVDRLKIEPTKPKPKWVKTDDGEWSLQTGKLVEGIPETFHTIVQGSVGNKTGYHIYDKDFKHIRMEKSLKKAKDRLKIEPSETELYSGIPLDKISKEIKGLFNKLTGRKKSNVIITPPPNPFPEVKAEARELIFERAAGLGLANYDTNKFINSIEQRLTEKQKETMIFVLENTNVPKEFNRSDIQKIINRDKKHLESVAKDIKEHFDIGFKNIKKNIPDLTVKQIEDYVTHLWDIPRHQRAEATAWFSTQNRFLERRFIPTYAEGIKRGYKPKTLDISEIIKVHDAVSNRAIENTKYVKALLAMKRDGIPLVQRGSDAPLDWIEVDYPALTRRIALPKGKAKKKGEFVKESKVRVHPDLVRPLKTIFEERFDHPVISAYEAINGIMKKSMLSVSLFHHGALGEVGVALGIPLKAANIYFNPAKIYKALVKGELDVFAKEKIAKDGVAHGLQLGATADIPVARIQEYLNSLARLSEGLPIVNRITSFLKEFNSVWDKALWSYLHDSLKLYGYESLVGSLDPKLDTELVRQSKREIAQFVNDTFGGQNWDTLMMTPKEVQMMTWSLLSADWTVSTTRQALAPTGIGKVYKGTAGIRKKVGWKFWARAGLFFGIGMNVLNAMFRDWDMKENPQFYEDKEYSFIDKTMLGNTIGKKTYLFKGRYDDGTERYVRWGKQFRDFFELFVNLPKKAGGKIAPLPQLIAQVFTGHSFSGFKNDDIYGKEGLDKALGILKTIAKSPLPISTKRFMQENMEFKPLDIVMQSTKGMSRYTAMEYFKNAIIDGDEEMLRDVYVGALRNNLPAFTLFNSGLSWAEAEISADLLEDVKEIEDTKNRLSAADSSGDKRRFGRLLSRLLKEKADKEQGLKLFKAALTKARVHHSMSPKKDIKSLPSRTIGGGRRGKVEDDFISFE